MEEIKNGNLIISKGENIVIVENLKGSGARKELFDFVDSLVGKGYTILDTMTTFSVSNGFHYHDRWVLKSPIKE